MRSIKWAVIYGLAVWAIPFVVAILIFPIHTADRPFFESIMPVTGVLAAVFFSVLYFNKVESRFIKEGILLGSIFFVISVGIDLLAFSWGPMAMPLIAYIKDIGFTYLAMPIITIGVGYALDKKV